MKAVSFFFNDPSTADIYTLSLHDALPISACSGLRWAYCNHKATYFASYLTGGDCVPDDRSEERFSRNAETDLVCRLLLEKKKTLDPLHTFGGGEHAHGDDRTRAPSGEQPA